MSEEAPPYETKEELPPPYEEPISLKRVHQAFVSSIMPIIQGYPRNPRELALRRVSLFFENLSRGVFTIEFLDILLPYFLRKDSPTLEYVEGNFYVNDHLLLDYKRLYYEDFVEFADAVVALTQLLLFVPEIKSLNNQLVDLF